MITDFKATEFESETELYLAIDELDRAEFTPLARVKKESPLEIEPLYRWKGIMNSRTEEIEGIVSNNYTLVQNQEAFLPMADAISELGMKIKGKVVDYGRMARVEVWFPEIGFTPSDGKRVFLGTKFENSYNRTRSFLGSINMLRLVCSNGLMVPEEVGVAFRIKHYGQQDIKLAVENFVSSLIDSIGKIANKYESMATDKIPLTSLELYVEQLTETKKARKRIAELVIDKYSDGEEFSRYGLYNGLTDYISNDLGPEKLTTLKKLEVAGNRLVSVSFDEMKLEVPV
jgi:hypothetical protein